MKMTLKTLFLAMALSIFALSAPAFAADKVITVGIANDMPPVCYIEKGKGVGFEYDLWEAIGQKINAKIEYKPANFSILFGNLDNDDVDFIACYIAINPVRQERYNFTVPYAHGFMMLMTLKSNNSVPNGLADCSGKNVAVTATSNGRMLIDEYNKTNNANINILAFEDEASALQSVEMGQAEGFFSGAGTMARYIQNGFFDGKFVGPAERITDTAYVYNKNNERTAELAKEVDKAILELKADGTITAISMKWLGIDITDPNAGTAF